MFQNLTGVETKPRGLLRDGLVWCFLNCSKEPWCSMKVSPGRLLGSSCQPLLAGVKRLLCSRSSRVHVCGRTTVSRRGCPTGRASAGAGLTLSFLLAFPSVAAVCLHHAFCLVPTPSPLPSPLRVVVSLLAGPLSSLALALGRLLFACLGSASGRSWQWPSRWTEPCHGSSWDGGAKSCAGFPRQVSVGRFSRTGIYHPGGLDIWLEVEMLPAMPGGWLGPVGVGGGAVWGQGKQL
jgi:hypothetical protein